MQLQTSATQIDYYPEGTGKRYVKRTIWHPGSDTEMVTFATCVKSDMVYDVNNYIANGAEVTGFNLDKMPQSEYMPMSC